jgi:hypothetical protein
MVASQPMVTDVLGNVFAMSTSPLSALLAVVVASVPLMILAGKVVPMLRLSGRSFLQGAAGAVVGFVMVWWVMGRPPLV